MIANENLYTSPSQIPIERRRKAKKLLDKQELKLGCAVHAIHNNAQEVTMKLSRLKLYIYEKTNNASACSTLGLSLKRDFRRD